MDKQKNVCEFEDYFLDALDGALPAAQRDALNAHLKDCALCRQKYDEFHNAHRLLVRSVRPAPPKEIFSRYQASLRSTFDSESPWRRLAVRLRRARETGMPSRQWALGISGAAAILLIGVIIGRFLLQTNSISVSSSGSQTAARQADSDRQFISDFLTQSEIWLMEVAHTDNAEGLDGENLTMNRDLARRLLTRSASMENKLMPMNQTTILEFLNRLELVLLETSGARDQELDAAFREIREVIRETSLLSEIQNIQQLIDAPQREGA